MIEVQIGEHGISNIVAELQATPNQCTKALRSTLSKMARWLQTRTTKGLSAELQVQQKIIRRRLRKTNIIATSEGYTIRLWYGLNDISLIHLNARETKKGVTAGKRKVDGAFIAKGQVFKRAGKSRLPIEKQAVVIKKQADDYLESAIDERAFEAQFMKTFEHELRWQTR